MKRASRYVLNILVISVFAVYCVAAAAQTQSQELYVISAKAGKVNLISGKVTFQRKADHARPSSSMSDLDSGDALKTGADGRVEVLLNPGSYVRVAENSELEMTNSALDSLHLTLKSGSAVIEATGTGGTRLLAQISTPQTSITIDRNGVYRLNVLPAGTTEVLVYKGRALVGPDAAMKVKDGRKAIISNGAIEIAKFDKKSLDVFDSWSKERAKELATANRRLSDRALNNAFASYRRGGAFGYGYAPYFGLWAYDPLLRCYTFLPFYSGWSSPYGFGYSNGFGLPWYYYRPVLLVNPATGSRGGTVVTGPTPSPAPDGTFVGRRPHRRDRDGLDNPSARPLPDGAGQRRGADRFDRDFGAGRSGGVDGADESFGRGRRMPNGSDQRMRVETPSSPSTVSPERSQPGPSPMRGRGKIEIPDQ